jgi:polysaccharide biosynthesis/export protein
VIAVRTITIALLFFILPYAVRAHQSSTAGDQPGGMNSKATDGHATDVPAVPPDYRIGVSDVIAVNVWKDSDLSSTVPVRPDGKISLPLIGDLEAAGKTTRELHDLVVTRLKPYVPDPDVTVIVEQINSQKYFIMGQVAHPGSYPLTVPTTVVEALAAAGGFVDWAKTGNVMVVRRNGNQTERIRFNYKQWLKKKSTESALQLKNGDVVVVQ